MLYIIDTERSESHGLESSEIPSPAPFRWRKTRENAWKSQIRNALIRMRHTRTESLRDIAILRIGRTGNWYFHNPNIRAVDYRK